MRVRSCLLEKYEDNYEAGVHKLEGVQRALKILILVHTSTHGLSQLLQHDDVLETYYRYQHHLHVHRSMDFLRQLLVARDVLNERSK